MPKLRNGLGLADLSEFTVLFNYVYSQTGEEGDGESGIHADGTAEIGYCSREIAERGVAYVTSAAVSRRSALHPLAGIKVPCPAG